MSVVLQARLICDRCTEVFPEWNTSIAGVRQAARRFGWAVRRDTDGQHVDLCKSCDIAHVAQHRAETLKGWTL